MDSMWENRYWMIKCVLKIYNYVNDILIVFFKGFLRFLRFVVLRGLEWWICMFVSERINNDVNL